MSMDHEPPRHQIVILDHNNPPTVHLMGWLSVAPWVEGNIWRQSIISTLPEARPGPISTSDVRMVTLRKRETTESSPVWEFVDGRIEDMLMIRGFIPLCRSLVDAWEKMRLDPDGLGWAAALEAVALGALKPPPSWADRNFERYLRVIRKGPR